MPAAQRLSIYQLMDDTQLQRTIVQLEAEVDDADARLQEPQASAVRRQAIDALTVARRELERRRV